MHFTRFRHLNLNIAMRQWRNRVKWLRDRYFNNRRIGKDARKPRTLGLLEHSGNHGALFQNYIFTSMLEKQHDRLWTSIRK